MTSGMGPDRLVSRVTHDRESADVVIVLRVGWADGLMQSSGVLDSLLMHAVHSADQEADVILQARVNPVTTMLTLSGETLEVDRELQRLLEALHSTDLGEVERLLEALRDLDPDPASRIDMELFERFGPVGPGLAALPRFGLDAVTPQQVADFGRHFVSAGNVRVVVAAPDGVDIHVRLPDGPLRAVPEFHPRLPPPTWTVPAHRRDRP